jgi:hypothetical protein
MTRPRALPVGDDTRGIIDAINYLTRVTLALHGSFTSKSEAIRRLHELAIPSSRIAAILAIPGNDVRSAIAKAKKGKTTLIEKRLDEVVDG